MTKIRGKGRGWAEGHPRNAAIYHLQYTAVLCSANTSNADRSCCINLQYRAAMQGSGNCK